MNPRYINAVPQAKRDWRPRLSEEITEEQFWKLKNLVPHGYRKVIISNLVDSLISWLSVEEARDGVLKGLISGRLVAKLEVSDAIKRLEDECDSTLRREGYIVDSEA